MYSSVLTCPYQIDQFVILHSSSPTPGLCFLPASSPTPGGGSRLGGIRLAVWVAGATCLAGCGDAVLSSYEDPAAALAGSGGAACATPRRVSRAEPSAAAPVEGGLARAAEVHGHGAGGRRASAEGGLSCYRVRRGTNISHACEERGAGGCVVSFD